MSAKDHAVPISILLKKFAGLITEFKNEWRTKIKNCNSLSKEVHFTKNSPRHPFKKNLNQPIIGKYLSHTLYKENKNIRSLHP